jgi:hypothetical protein
MTRKQFVAYIGVLTLIESLPMGVARGDDFGSTAIDDILKPPAGHVLSLSEPATGVQIYRCSAQKDKPGSFSWSLNAPEAKLHDDAGEVSGEHYAGPTWQDKDGSKVVGETIAKTQAPESGSIPWLLLRAKSTAGRGVFSEITFIQRVRTHGGNAPSIGCDQNREGKEVKVPYSALYRFFKLAR